MKGRKGPVFPQTAHGKAIISQAAAKGPSGVLPCRASPRGSPLYGSSGCSTCSVASLLGQHSPVFVNNLFTDVSSINPVRAI